MLSVKNTGGSPIYSAANARSRALWVSPYSVCFLWRMLERRGAAEPLVYLGTRHSTIFLI